MRIGILGTGNLATALATGWARAGHDIIIGGRSTAAAEAIANRIGGTARPVSAVAAGADAVLLAVRWDGVTEMLTAAGGPAGALADLPLVDPTNAVEHGVGALQTEPARSAAGHIAALAPGAHVVKAFHLFPAERWVTPDAGPVTVAMCGDDERALDVVGSLVRDVGGVPAVLGTLDRVRQLEEVAGFVIGLAFAGVDPQSAIPSVPR
ncbi:NADP oxidoreductase [Micromonospora sp. TSRI0369]|uniref:NADPH-dependent F420 reductase n=1 Tax=Micromonospora sp. TSRI0369 TaxID=1703936 RepID=UPI00093C14C6|nr:NAD(P)-binding domain-containing protein [Micromonospora sp. TSRI0369]OKJ46133.1 NADP oxidoreductase [Micromonospora sp. TSRI0369]